MESIKTITLIGSGNVATHLGKAFLNKGFIIKEVYSKDRKHADVLAQSLNASATDNIIELNSDSDIYIICIKDDAIESVVQQFSFQDKIIVHTSGSIGIDVLNEIENYGIFYPLQTFSKEKIVTINTVPFCIEANNIETQNSLIELANSLSNNVQLISSEQRKTIHLAAVFACNFSNNMFVIADDILKKNGMNLDLLKPLILETASKISDRSPKDVQTGPAIRNDQEVIKNHLQMLADSKDYQDIYEKITNSIIKTK